MSKNQSTEAEEAVAQAEEAPPQTMGIIARARAAEQAAAAERERAAIYEGSEPQAPAHNLLYHADGAPRMMVICRQNGAGEREISVEEWNRNPAFYRAEAGAWVIKYTEAVAQNHSEGVV